MGITELEKAIKKSWSRETSYNPETWREDNPELGQCAVTALVVKDYLGGDIFWSEAVLPDGQKVSHYFNSIDGKIIDLTLRQFPPGTIIPPGREKKKGYATTREFMLSDRDTTKRYRILERKVKENLIIVYGRKNKRDK